MAFPVVPLVIGVLVLAAAAGRKRNGKNGNGGNGNGNGWSPGRVSGDGAPPPSDDPQPGQPCPTAPGVFGVWDEQGECKVFWSPEIAGQVLAELEEVYAEMGSPGTLCDPDEYLPGPDEWLPNPVKQELLARALERYYGLPEGTFPAPPDAPYWFDVAWREAYDLVRVEMCGQQKIT